MATNNILGLLIEIAADPSKATAALEAVKAKAQETAAAAAQGNEAVAASASETAAQELATTNTTQEAMRRSVAESARAQGASLEEVGAIYKQLGISGQQAAGEIKAAFGQAGAALDETTVKAQSAASAIRQEFSTLTAFRRVVYSSIGLVAFAYLIPELGRVHDAIVRIALDLGGFSTAAQDAFAQASKAYDQFYEHLHGADYTRTKLKAVQEDIARTQKQIDDLEKAGVSASDKQIAALAGTYAMGAGAAADYDSRITALRSHLTDMNAQEALLNVQLAQEAVGHGKAAKAVKEHSNAEAEWEQRTQQAYAYWQQRAGEHQQAVALMLRQEQELQRGADQLKLAEGRVTWDLYIDTVRRAAKEQEAIYKGMEAKGQVFDQEFIRSHQQHAQSVRGLSAAYNSLAAQTRTAISQMVGEFTGWGGVAARVADQIISGIERQIIIEKTQAVEHQISQFSMMKATTDALKQTAEVQAVMEAAKGFAALADYDFWSAAQHFAAAALFGTVSAFQIASIAGAFGGGGGTAGAVGTTTAAGPKTLTAAGTPAGGTTVIQIDGSIDPKALYSGRALMTLIQAINGALSNGSAHLVITTPPVLRS